MTFLTSMAGYDVYLLVQGFPGKSMANGGLGWSTVVLLTGNGRNILVDTGPFSARRGILAGLEKLGISRFGITDILLTHAHYDHMMNWTFFPHARVHLEKEELAWALQDDIETSLCAELYVEQLSRSPRLETFVSSKDVFAGIGAMKMPGHTPHHVVFVMDEGDRRLIIAADAVKNRAEFLAGRAVSTLDAEASAASIEAVKALWLEKPGTLLVCGHDLPMENVGGQPRYIGERRAGIVAWLDPSLDAPTDFALRQNEPE